MSERVARTTAFVVCGSWLTVTTPAPPRHTSEAGLFMKTIWMGKGKTVSHKAHRALFPAKLRNVWSQSAQRLNLDASVSSVLDLCGLREKCFCLVRGSRNFMNNPD